VNFIVPAKPMHLPIYPDQPVTRPVAPVGDNASEFHDATRQQPSAYVYRGELLESVANDKRYRPHYNLQIAPQNQYAIDTYHKVANEPPLTGQLLDGLI